jgi:hypothetical protein
MEQVFVYKNHVVNGKQIHKWLRYNDLRNFVNVNKNL